jgi:oxalate decarboxylase/phosphoglucose isomerase-like protein (cupin superfamily)
MKIHHLKPAFRDQRGQITDIVQHTPFDSVTIITSVSGAIRANHYHKESIQFSYVLSGRLLALTQLPDGPVETADLVAGDLLETPPLERHALQALEDSVLLIITRGPRGGKGYEDDTFRVPPLQAGPSR